MRVLTFWSFCIFDCKAPTHALTTTTHALTTHHTC